LVDGIVLVATMRRDRMAERSASRSHDNAIIVGRAGTTLSGDVGIMRNASPLQGDRGEHWRPRCVPHRTVEPARTMAAR
jgi:hypothetical protein